MEEKGGNEKHLVVVIEEKWTCFPRSVLIKSKRKTRGANFADPKFTEVA